MKKIFRQRMLGAKKIEDMTDAEAIQVAMLIDTDGSIHSSKAGNRPGIASGMCGIIPIEMAVKWGGTIHKKFVPKTKNFKYMWTFHKRELLRSMLIRIKPYLIQKRKQAELALEMLDLLDKKAKVLMFTPIQIESFKKRLKKLSMEISRLNHARAPNIDITKLEGIY